MNKHKVLIPIDGRDFSRQIVPCVRRFLPVEQNELILLRVGDEVHGMVGMPAKPVAWDVSTSMYSSERDLVASKHPIYASQEWESAVADVRHSMDSDVHLLEMAGYAVTSVVRIDKSPGTAILRYIETHDVDLVAMTTHGRTGVGRMLFGNVAQTLAQHLQIPMMIVRPTAEL